MVGWKIWYDDGSTFSNEDGVPEAAPMDGVLHIWQPRGTNKELLTKCDYYRWADDHWVGGSLADLEKWLRRVCPTVKYGRAASDGVYWATKHEAIIDGDAQA